MLDGRVKTLHPKIHGGLLADLGNEGHRRDLDLHGIRPFELVVSNLYPFEARPDIETIDIGGPAMTRAAAKNHAWVTIVTSPDQYGPLLTELHANDGTVGGDDPPVVRSRGLRPHRRVRRRDRPVAPGRRGPARAPRRRARTDRRDAALRREPAPARRALPAHGRHELVGRRPPARRRRALVPQLLRHRRGVEARARSRRRPGVRDHQAREPVRRRARRRRSTPRTAARSSATSVPRSAGSSRSTGRSTPRPSSSWCRARRPTS